MKTAALTRPLSRALTGNTEPKRFRVGPSVLACAYPLVGDVAEMIGAVQMVVSGSGNQKATHTVTQSASYVSAAALPDGAYPSLQQIDLAGDVVQFGFTDIAFSKPASTGVDWVWQLFGYVAGTGGGGIEAGFMIENGTSGNGDNTIHVSLNQGGSYLGPFASAPSAVWFVVDKSQFAGSGGYRAWFDFGAGPVEQTSGYASAPLSDTVFIGIGVNISKAAAGDAGKTMTATLVTGASSMPYLVSGAIDLCGNVISSSGRTVIDGSASYLVDSYDNYLVDGV